MSQARFNPESIRGMVKMMAYCTFFVANVNFNDDGTLNVNLNRFENDNVWNAENRHRVVIPKLAVFSCLFGGSFILQSSLPSAQHATYFFKIF